jgi:ATP-binding cassette subfamily B multidrug efflux pump
MIPLLRTYLRPYLRPIVVVLVLLLIQAIGNLSLPDLNADIIDNGIAKGDTGYIIQVGGLMLVVTFLLGAAAVTAVYFGAKVAMGFGRDVRSAIFGTVERFSQVDVDHFGPASLITRNTNDVQQVQMVVFMALTVIASAPIMIIGGIFMAVRLDPELSLLLVVILPLMLVIIGLVMVRAIPLFRAMQLKIDRINQVMRETLAGVRVIRAFVRTEHEERRFDEASVDLFHTGLRVNRLFALTIPTMTAILNLSTVAVMWFGAVRVDSGAMQIGDLTAFLQYLMQILFSVLMAVLMFIMVPRAAVSAGRIREVLEHAPSISDPDVPTPLPVTTGGATLELEAVEFRYPGAEEPVLRDISFTARPGEVTAIVGSTGSGKTTLVNLIPRLFDATAGTVRLDGVDIRDLDRRDLWRRIGFIPQKAFLFSGTVASNLRYGDAEASDEELWRALEIAQGRDFVEAMDGGLDAPIVQGGTNVSGGQRQRLAIARALIVDPRILILDEATSALDPDSESIVNANIRRIAQGRTVIIISHRLSSLVNSDAIMVLEQGALLDIGKHAELLEKCEIYRGLWNQQNGHIEAAMRKAQMSRGPLHVS